MCSKGRQKILTKKFWELNGPYFSIGREGVDRTAGEMDRTAGEMGAAEREFRSAFTAGDAL